MSLPKGTSIDYMLTSHRGGGWSPRLAHLNVESRASLIDQARCTFGVSVSLPTLATLLPPNIVDTLHFLAASLGYVKMNRPSFFRLSLPTPPLRLDIAMLVAALLTLLAADKKLASLAVVESRPYHLSS